MASYTSLFPTGELIPPNPASLDFESNFRSNLQAFLEGMQTFEGIFNTTISVLQGGGTDLSEGLINLTQGADISKQAIIESLGTGSKDWMYTDTNGTTIKVAGNLGYASLSDRFSAIDTAVSANASLLQESFSLTGDGSLTNTSFTSIQDRFHNSEDLLRAARESLLTHADSLSMTGTNSSGHTVFSSIQERFQSLESRAVNLESQTSTLANYATIDGDLGQFFQASSLLLDGTLSFNTSSKITNLADPDPNTGGDAVNINYLHQKLFGDVSIPFDVQAPTHDSDSDQDTWAISRAFADGRYARQEGDPAINFNANVLTVSDLQLVGDLDMNSNHITELPTVDANDPDHVNYATNRDYVDSVKIGLSNQIGAVAMNMVPTYGTPEDGKFLSVSSSGLIWVNPPTVDTSIPSYEWLSHPQVAFHSVQFEEQLYVNHTLAANRVYYVAGNLEFPEKMADGTTPCNSKLTVASGSGASKGATLIVQGHIIGKKLTRLIEDNTHPNPPRIIVQNWADSRADYVISGIVNTSDLNLTEDLFFASRLVLESGATLNIDSGCNLTFRELVNIDGSGTIHVTSGSVNYFNAQGLGGFTYIDPSSNPDGHHIYKFSP